MSTGIKIATAHLGVYYANKPALEDVSLEIRTHEILSVIGPANSGKSSFLMTLNRMLDQIPDTRIEGQVFIDGNDIREIRDVESLRRRVGLVYALPHPLPLSVRDNVLFGVRLKNKLKKNDEDIIVEKSLRAAFLWDEVKDRLKLSGLSLSGGQQQRLCLARTLAVEPEIILYDEPCSGLDPISTAKVEEAIKELSGRHTQILVTNNTKQAARVGIRTAFFLMGKLIEVDDTLKIFTAPQNKKTEDYVTGKFG